MLHKADMLSWLLDLLLQRQEEYVLKYIFSYLNAKYSKEDLQVPQKSKTFNKKN